MSILGLDPKKFGTFEEYTVFLTKELHNRGARHIVVFSNDPPEHIMKEFRATPVILRSIPFSKSKFSTTLNLIRLIKYFHPDIIHTHFLKFTSLPLFTIMASGRYKLVFSEHISNVFNPPKDFLKVFILSQKRAFKNICAKRFAKIVTPSDYMKNMILQRDRLPVNKFCTIYNGANLNFFKPGPGSNARKKLGINHNNPIISTIAQAIPIKGIEHFIKAAAIVSKEIPQAQFYYIGDGPCLRSYKELADKLHLKNITFTGFIQREIVNQILNAGDIFVISSVEGEAFCLVVLEAMAAGKPVVGTNVGGTPEAIVNGLTGLLVEPRNPSSMASAIVSLCLNKKHASRMGMAGRLRMEQFFSLESMVTKTVDLYEKLLTGKDDL